MKINTSRYLKGLLVAGGGLLSTACPMDDDEAAEEGPVEALGLSIMTEAGSVEADFTCLGQLSQPRATSMQEWTVPAVAFAQVDEDGNPLLVPGLRIEIFPDNVMTSEQPCEGCVLATDEGDGSYSFEGPADGWVAYRVLESSEGMGPPILRTSEVNFQPEGEAFNIMFAPVLDGLHQQLGVERDTSRALVAGRLVDCSGIPVKGATVRVLDDQGRVLDEDDGLLVLYMEDTGPAPELSSTSFAGRWALVNVPVEDETAYIEMRAADGTLVSCEKISIAANGFSVLRTRPLRADAPTVCER